MTQAFSGLGLRDSLVESLQELQILQPTDIQKRAIPALLNGHPVVAVAETGSGKTLAYALPILQLLKQREEAGNGVTASASPRAVILVPTRELGEQVARDIKQLTHNTRVRIRSLVGNTAADVARRNVSQPFEILVASPGRLSRFLDDRLLSLQELSFLILDEADQLLDMGFRKDIERILKARPEGLQVALFSATLPPSVESLVAERFTNPTLIRTQGSHRVVATLTTRHKFVDPARRFIVFKELLEAAPGLPTLVFCNTREQCTALAEQLDNAGINHVLYHGEVEPELRKLNLEAFKNGQATLLISTDLGSRGLHLEELPRVINYHLPRQVELYLHRVGRTARAGKEGEVINLVAPKDQALMRRLAGTRTAKDGDAGLAQLPATQRAIRTPKGTALDPAAPGESNARGPRSAPGRGRQSEGEERPTRGAGPRGGRSSEGRPSERGAGPRGGRSSEGRPSERGAGAGGRRGTVAGSERRGAASSSDRRGSFRPEGSGRGGSSGGGQGGRGRGGVGGGSGRSGGGRKR